jgi:predicted glycoside hydrolase/deacetylase ChbG (UPF0249 family)
MRIVTNADDFGLDADTTSATIDCFKQGALTSASIMPRMPATDQAVAFALENPQHSFGLHLTFVCDTVEAPISAPERLPALVGNDGRFLPSQTVRKLAALRRIPVEQIELETAAQIDLLSSRGIRLSHVDSHGHLHKFAVFRAALKKVLGQRGILRVRNVQDIYVRRPLKSPTYWFGPWWRSKIMANFKTTEHFYMCTSAWDENWPEKLLSKISGDTLEVGVHPGHLESWRAREDHAIRQFAQLAQAQGHQLISWRDI